VAAFFRPLSRAGETRWPGSTVRRFAGGTGGRAGLVLLAAWARAQNTMNVSTSEELAAAILGLNGS